jgi:hypothetical protein
MSLSPSASIVSGLSPMNADTRRGARARERGVLREEPVARMDRVGAHALRDLDHALEVEVAVLRWARADGIRLVGHEHVQRGAIRLAEDGDAGATGLAQRSDDSHGDLAAIRDEHAVQTRHQLSRTTHATPRPPSCESDRWDFVAPSAVKRSSAARGQPQGGHTSAGLHDLDLRPADAAGDARAERLAGRLLGREPRRRGAAAGPDADGSRRARPP